MALLRHATLAYAAQDSRPAEVLEKLSEFAGRRSRGNYFATVLCAQISLDAGRLSVASAGHLAPLILDNGHADFVALALDPAIGVRGTQTSYHETVSELPRSATLIAYTDGLVERRGEVIDDGMKRLRSLATATRKPLSDLIATLARDLTSTEHHDDTAIVGVRWER
jgi:serine phosphatase RsbU (regulator of sigma subunit)